MKRNMMALLMVSSAISAFAVDSAAPSYVVDKELGKGTLNSAISYIALDASGRLLVPQESKVLVVDPDSGATVLSFDSGLANITSIASDKSGIYVLSTKMQQETREFQGQKRTYSMPAGIACKRFDMQGKNGQDVSLPGAKAALSARVYKGKLYVADSQAKKVVVFDLATGRKTAQIGDNLRLCCGIFDFCVDPANGDVLIANLGAFQLQRYDSGGKLKSSFGKRGTSEADFGGCCNPVSAEVLIDGNVVLVEKSPSKVKLYRSDGSFLASLPQVTELVEGCSRVPVIRDAKGNIYVASNRKGNIAVIKCTLK
jgi:hypothetical protein